MRLQGTFVLIMLSLKSVVVSAATAPQKPTARTLQGKRAKIKKKNDHGGEICVRLAVARGNATFLTALLKLYYSYVVGCGLWPQFTSGSMAATNVNIRQCRTSTKSAQCWVSAATAASRPNRSHSLWQASIGKKETRPRKNRRALLANQ